MKIKNKKEVTNYYKNKNVANNYIKKRFTEPLNVFEHKKQVSIINSIIKNNSIKEILEFAPGPARITTELKINGGTSIDSSENMLKIARDRMNKKGKKWFFIKGDIFNLKLKKKYDLIFGIRFFLHFKKNERQKLYSQAHKNLKKKGLLVFEIMNKDVVFPLRNLLGNKRYIVYDKLYIKKEFFKEMNDNGFKVIKLTPILNNFWIQALFSRPLKVLGMNIQAEKVIKFLEKINLNQPYEWIALCQKK